MQSSDPNAQLTAYPELMEWIERCTFYSASALWFYEYLQTLPMEIENIWRRRISTPSILFLINRYMASIAVVVSICGEIGGPAAIASYNDLLHVQRVCGIITGLSTSLLFTIRVYVINGKRRSILLFAGILIVARVGCYIWLACVIYAAEVQAVPLSMRPLCPADLWRPCLSVSTAINSLSLAFDTFVLVLTLNKVVRQVQEMRLFAQSTSIAEIILRDGILYYALILVITAIALASDQVSQIENPAGSNVGLNNLIVVVAAFSAYVPNILINRLVLNLKNYDKSSARTDAAEMSLPPLNFAPVEDRILGSIGAPIDYNQWSLERFDEAEETRQQNTGQWRRASTFESNVE